MSAKKSMYDSADWDADYVPSSNTAGGSGGYDGVKYRSFIPWEMDDKGNDIEPMVFRFLANPDDKEARDSGLWFMLNYQISAREGLEVLPKEQFPNGCFSIPLDGPDDELLALVRPYRYNTDNNDQVHTQAVALGVAVDDDGEQRIVEMTARQWRMFCKRLEQWRDDFDDDDFSIVGQPVTIQKEGRKGTPGAANLVISRKRKATTIKPGDPMWPDEPIDLREHIREIRESVEEAIADWAKVTSGGKPTTATVVDETSKVAPTPDAPVHKKIESGNGSTGPAGLEALTVGDLRELLRENKVSFPSAAKKPVLVELATEAGIKAEDAVPF